MLLLGEKSWGNIWKVLLLEAAMVLNCNVDQIPFVSLKKKVVLMGGKMT
jgi:hypothetical protein